jgi:SAM-dependent methyltransferase
MKRVAPAAERNKQPILEVLQRVLPKAGGLLLEIASGSGQHAAHFARGLPAWTLQPTDVEADALASIAAHVAEAQASGLNNLRPPRPLDVRLPDWGSLSADAIFSANMIHVAPWDCALGLLDGASRVLAPGGLLIVYGPFTRGGQHTAASNAAFDASLRQRDPSFGVRDLDVVLAEAARRQLGHLETVSMPANNLTVVMRRH